MRCYGWQRLGPKRGAPVRGGGAGGRARLRSVRGVGAATARKRQRARARKGAAVPALVAGIPALPAWERA